MCGCFIMFPCLLFGGEDMWTELVIKDLKHFLEKSRKHSLSKCYLDNEVSLYMLGIGDVRWQVDDDY